MEPFELLTDADCLPLAGALRSGRLQEPYSTVAVQRYCPASHVNVIAARLQELNDQGMRPEHLALLIETIARLRSSHPQQAEVVDLVWTGPEATGVTNRATAVVVRELFDMAESEVLIAGFAVYQGREVFRRLAERMKERPELRVRLFLDVQRHPKDTTLSEDLVRRFSHHFRTHEWPGEQLPEIYYDPRSLDLDSSKRSSLHAKCIVVDQRVALVTSANFTEAAQLRNIEVGALIHSERFAVGLASHFDRLREAGVLKRV